MRSVDFAKQRISHVKRGREMYGFMDRTILAPYLDWEIILNCAFKRKSYAEISGFFMTS